MAKYSAHERWKRNQAKKARRKSKHKSSLLDSLDYSKRARGQSKREYAAQQLGGKLDYKSGRITIRKKRSTPKKNVSAIYAGPSRPGEVKPGYYNPYTEQVQEYNTSDYKTDIEAYNRRKKASKAKAKNTYEATNALNGRSFAEASKQYNQGRSVPSKGGTVGTNAPWRGYLRKGINLIKKTPVGAIASKEAKSLGFDLTNYLGVPKAQAMEFNVGDNPINNPTTPDVATGYGAGDTQYFNDYIPTDVAGNVIDSYQSASDRNNPNQNVVNSNDVFNQQNPYEQSRPNPTPIDNGAIYSGPNQNSSLANYDTAPVVNTPSPIATTPSPIDNTPIQPNLGGTARKMASTGAFGNGALVSNRYDDATKEYIKRLQGSVKGDFGMDETKRQIENLLNSLNSRYGEYKRTGEKELSKAKEADLRKLAALFTAYNTTDSEQRMQQQERTQNDYQDRLADLIAKLDTQKSQDITDVKNKGLDAYSRIKQAQQSAQDKVAQLIYQAQQDAQNRAYQAQKDAWDRNYKQQQLAISRAKKKEVTPKYTIAPNAQGGNSYFYGTQPITEGQYMAGKYGVGISDSLDRLDQGGTWEIDPITGEKVWVTD